VKRILVLLILAGCASRTPVEEPTIRSVPPALIAETGASLYIVEAPDDWLDDGGMIFQVAPAESDPSPIGPKPSTNAQWLGEQAFSLVLRTALSQKSVQFIAHADFQPWAAYPSEVTLFSPDVMKRVGFRVKLKASPTEHPEYAAIEWEAEQLTDGPKGRIATPISKGACRLPYRGTVMMHHRKDDHRFYALLLRLTSLRNP
jgi:hypothetical protein